jgi:hypothetical protein
VVLLCQLPAHKPKAEVRATGITFGTSGVQRCALFVLRPRSYCINSNQGVPGSVSVGFICCVGTVIAWRYLESRES